MRIVRIATVEAAVAHCALVRPYAEMPIDVRVQLHSLPEPCRAHIARVLQDALMHHAHI